MEDEKLPKEQNEGLNYKGTEISDRLKEEIIKMNENGTCELIASHTRKSSYDVEIKQKFYSKHEAIDYARCYLVRSTKDKIVKIILEDRIPLSIAEEAWEYVIGTLKAIPFEN